MLAAIGAAGIGAVAIVAVLISNSGNTAVLNVGSNTVLPTQTQAHSASPRASAHASAARATGNLGGGNPVSVAGTEAPFTPVAPTPSKPPTPAQVTHSVEVAYSDEVADAHQATDDGTAGHRTADDYPADHGTAHYDAAYLSTTRDADGHRGAGDEVSRHQGVGAGCLDN